jgi:hypothetical protein
VEKGDVAVTTFTVVRDDCDADRLTEYIADWRRGERHLFVLLPAIDHSIAAKIVASANTISTSVKGSNLPALAPLLLKHCAKGTRIYPFENDEKRVAELRDSLKSADVDVVEVCADRICMKPSLTSGGTTLETRAEIFLEVIILDHTEQSRVLFRPEKSPFSKSVNITSNNIEYEFRRLRKRALVNGSHFFLALASMRHLRNISPNDPEGRKSIEQAAATHLIFRTQEIRNITSMVGRLFVLALLVEAERLNLVRTGREVDRLEASLNEQLALVEDRLQTVPDQLSRILNPSDENLLDKARSFLATVRDLPINVPDSKLLSKRLNDREMKALSRDVNELNSLFLDQLLKDKK